MPRDVAYEVGREAFADGEGQEDEPVRRPGVRGVGTEHPVPPTLSERAAWAGMSPVPPPANGATSFWGVDGQGDNGGGTGFSSGST
jgi:hypothetical protein